VGKLGKALLHTTLLLGVLGFVAVLFLDRIVGTAVEEGGRRALGVKTEVDGVSLGLLRGRVALRGLAIDNPEGFAGEKFLELGSVRVEAPPRALLGDPVVIPSIVLEDLSLSIEGSPGGTNYGRLLRNVGGGGAGPESAEPESGSARKEFVVRELVVRNVRARVSVGGLGSELAARTVEIPELRLTDLGSASGGMELAELIRRVTREVVQGVARSRPELAGVLAPDLRGRIESEAREGLGRLREDLLRPQGGR
jgi:hypothetical protein